MQSKKIGPRIIIAAFVVVICLSWVLGILLEKYVDSTNYENRTLAERPVLSIENYDTFPEEYEAYLNDNLPFRNYLITMNSAIDYFIFHRPSNKRVIVGEDNWLFYANKRDGNPVGCYQGTNLLSEKKLQAIAQNCMDMKNFLNSQGKEFVIFIAPNKERIYSEYMPDQYGVPAEQYRALQVVQYLRENTDVRVVYPYEELMEAKKDLKQNIYYKTDTHWNWIGGYVGTCALMDELGIDIPDIRSDDITIATENETSGDLAGMINLNKMLESTDHEYAVTGYNTHNVQMLEGDINNTIVYQAENADARKIYVYRDSFALHMSAYIGSQFDDSYFRYKKTYSYDDFMQQNPDIFVYETVERYVGELEKFSIQ